MNHLGRPRLTFEKPGEVIISDKRCWEMDAQEEGDEAGKEEAWKSTRAATRLRSLGCGVGGWKPKVV